jgi:hypothetical protein
MSFLLSEGGDCRCFEPLILSELPSTQVKKDCMLKREEEERRKQELKCSGDSFLCQQPSQVLLKVFDHLIQAGSIAGI